MALAPPLELAQQHEQHGNVFLVSSHEEIGGSAPKIDFRPKRTMQKNGPPNGQAATYQKPEGIQNYLRLWGTYDPNDSGPSEPKRKWGFHRWSIKNANMGQKCSFLAQNSFFLEMKIFCYYLGRILTISGQSPIAIKSTLNFGLWSTKLGGTILVHNCTIFLCSLDVRNIVQGGDPLYAGFFSTQGSGQKHFAPGYMGSPLPTQMINTEIQI